MEDAGGIVGRITGSSVSSSENVGNVKGSLSSRVAGAAYQNSATFDSNQNSGSIEGIHYAGGIVGVLLSVL
jgi:hypothetical protein